MNPERFFQRAPSDGSVVANDNFEKTEASFEVGAQEATEVLKRTLSPEAWTLYESLSLAPTPEAFQKAIDTLNALSTSQLNYADPEMAEELENEILHNRQMSATIPVGMGRLVRVTRGMNGKYHFAAA